MYCYKMRNRQQHILLHAHFLNFLYPTRHRFFDFFVTCLADLDSEGEVNPFPQDADDEGPSQLANANHSSATK